MHRPYSCDRHDDSMLQTGSRCWGSIVSMQQRTGLSSLTGATYRKVCEHTSLKGLVVVLLRCKLEACVCHTCDGVAWSRCCHNFHVFDLHSSLCNGPLQVDCEQVSSCKQQLRARQQLSASWRILQGCKSGQVNCRLTGSFMNFRFWEPPVITTPGLA